MVTICTKKLAHTRENLLLSTVREKKESKDLGDFFSTLKNQSSNNKLRVLSGTSIPNSTFRSIHSATDSKKNLSKQEIVENAADRESNETLTQKRSSILSGTGTLDELKELKELLYKSSYVPKKVSTRRPTIEKIKSAIEKEKQNLIEENLLKNIKESVEMSDTSTSTEKLIIKKKLKKRKTKTSRNSSLTSSAQSKSTSNTSGKPPITIIKRKNKVKKNTKKENSKVDIEIQCSIYKMKNKDS